MADLKLQQTKVSIYRLLIKKLYCKYVHIHIAYIHILNNVALLVILEPSHC